MQTPTPTTDALNDRPSLVAGAIVDRADGYVILLHPDRPLWALTDEAGLSIARLLDGSRTLGSIASELAAGGSADQVAADLLPFLEDLGRAGLLAGREPDSPAPAPPRPPSMTIYVTEQCNLRCRHCAIVEGRMPQTTLSADDIRALIDGHLDLHPGATIAFLGGEPLMHPDCMELLEYACARTASVNIGTNGHFVTAEVAARLARSGASVQISLDGADPAVHDDIRGKGSFAKAWGALELLCAAGAGPRVMVATVLTGAALEQVQSLIDMCRDLGVWKLRFLPLNRIKAAVTNWDELEPDDATFRQLTRWLLFEGKERGGAMEVVGSFPGYVPEAAKIAGHWCPIGRTAIVDSQGDVYNCPAIKEPLSRAGNFRETPLKDIEEGDVNRSLREEMLQRRFAVEECRTCAWRNFCQGGCMAYSYFRTGDLYVNDEFCEFRRELYREHVLRRSGVFAARP